MLTYNDCLKLKDGKKLAHKTYLHKRWDGFSIKYWYTDIITIHPDDTYTINIFHSNTTKRRIEEFSPVIIMQKDYIWYVNGKPCPLKFRVNMQGEIICD
jgi:hypothetical protein